MKHVILLVTYNGETYIAEQVKSILKSANNSDFVICYFDDFSSDSTVSIVQELCKNQPLRQYFFPKQDTIALNFIQLLEISISDYGTQDSLFYFTDQDDIWALDKIKISQKLFDQFKFNLLVSKTQCFGTESRLIVPPTRRNILLDLAFNVSPGMSFCFSLHNHSKLLEFIRLFVWHDHGIFLLIKYFNCKIHYSSQILQYYRRHSSAFTSIHSLDYYNRFLYAVRNAVALSFSLLLSVLHEIKISKVFKFGT